MKKKWSKKLLAVVCALSMVMTIPISAAKQSIIPWYTVEEITIPEDAVEEVQKPENDFVTLNPDVLWWDFDEESGQTAYDKSGNGYDIDIGGATRAFGVTGSAISFDGVDDHCLQTINADHMPKTTATYAMWVYVDKPSVYATFLKNWGAKLNGQFQLSFDAGGKHLGVYVRDNSGKTVSLVEKEEFQTKKWVHLAVVADGANVIYYKDGTESGRIAYAGTLSQEFLTWGIGAKPNDIGNGVASSNAGYLDGKVDDIRIYSTPLTEENIKGLYNAAKPDSISIDTEPNKKVYKIGEDLDTEGTVITAAYATGESRIIPITECEISGFDNSEVGEQVVAISYLEQTAVFTVMVVQSEIVIPEPDIAWWKFDEGNGDITADSGKNNYTLTLNGPIWTFGQTGNALKFDGKDDYIAIADYEKPTTTATYAAWLYVDQYTTFGTVVRNWGGSKNGQIQLGLSKDGQHLETHIAQRNENSLSITDSEVFPLKQWVHVAMVADGANFILYKDGVAIGSKPYDGTLKADYKSLGIGIKPNDAGNGADSTWPAYLNGRLDDLRIYSTALTDTQMKMLYNLEKPVSIEVSKQPAKTVYGFGDELDTTDMVISASYLDGSIREIPSGEYEISDFDSYTLGAQVLTVTYEKQTAEFTVNVDENVRYLKKIKITTPALKHRFGVGADLDLSGMVLTATFSDGLQKEITNYTTSGFDSSTEGTCKVRISCTLGMHTVETAFNVSIGYSAKLLNPLKVREATEWTKMWDRRTGWINSDGIYSIPLNGKESIGSSDENTKTFWIYSDGFTGTVDEETLALKKNSMINHSASILTGNEPEKEPSDDKMRFIYGYKGDMSNSNIFKGIKWFMDGITIEDNLYLFGMQIGAGWRVNRIDIVKVPLVGGEPDLENYSVIENAPLVNWVGEYSVVFGSGIMANTEEAGAPNPDGYIYVYGYRMGNSYESQPLVSRVQPGDFEAFDKWEFWNGSTWTHDVADVNSKEAIIGPMSVSNESSVTPITEGIYAGKYMSVYCRSGQSSTMEYAIADTPWGPFSDGIAFFDAPEPEEYGYRTYVYNAKAHPHLSKEGHLLVSYNVNGKNYGTNEIYRSRWLELDLNTLSESPILSNVSSHKPVEASGWISADTEPRFAVDEVWQKRWEDDTPGDKWLQIDLEQNYYISKYILRTSTWNGSDSKYNTRDWKLSVSVDGENWTEVDTVTDNTAGKVVRTFDEIQARYVRLDITKAAQAGFDKAVVDAISIYGVAVPLKDKRINVALKKEVTASGGQDSAAKLVDGNYSDVNTDKWCDTSTGDKWIQVDLGEKQRISKYVVRHAGVAEATRYNTNCFKLQASNDGKRWVNIDQVDFNMHNITSMEVKPFKARYVRLYITKPTLSRNDVARIYELELYADEKKLVDKTELQEAFSKQ